MIYLDNAATTKPYVKSMEDAILFQEKNYYNPSALYQVGIDAKNEIKKVKEDLLKSLGAFNHEVIFTSCGTESDNYAVLSSVKKGVFLTDNGEHSAVYKSFISLRERGENVIFVSLNKDGSVNVDELLETVYSKKPDFVSIVHVNNETGAINDINYIAREVKRINPKTIFHSDGVQAFMKIPYALSNDIDLYSVSAHKINALKGMGALIVKKGVSVKPYILGGGQENGLRSGTENVFGIKVFHYSLLRHYNELSENLKRVLEMNKYVLDNIDRSLFNVISGENSSPYIISLSAIGVRGEVLMHKLETSGFIVGNGSACSSKNRFSRVIENCGYSGEILDGVIRISFSSDNTLEEIKEFVPILNRSAKELKEKLQ